MINLNIIPESQKKEVKLKVIHDHLKNFFELVFLVFLFYTIAFLFMKLILSNHFITTIENTTVLTKSTENYSKKVADINNKALNATIIQKDFIYWSKLIEKIRSNEPSGLNLNEITIKKDQIILAGSADKRESLLKFKANMENLGYFNEINLPIKNLLQKNNISFSITVEIKSYVY